MSKKQGVGRSGSILPEKLDLLAGNARACVFAAHNASGGILFAENRTPAERSHRIGGSFTRDL
jgi:hypothetical protein